MKRAIIIGAGGHGREVADILRDQARHNPDLTVLGFIDENERLHGQMINDVPVLGYWSWFEGVDRTEMGVVCAVGSPENRKRLVEHASSIGLSFINAVSPLAHLSPYAKVGEGLMMFPHSFASTNSVIGDHTVVNVGATISHDTEIGRYATLNPGVHLAGNVTIGEGCYIGVGSNIINGISIGSWTTVGAGAVVVKDLPDAVTAVGVPARVIRTKEKGRDE